MSDEFILSLARCFIYSTIGGWTTSLLSLLVWPYNQSFQATTQIQEQTLSLCLK